MMLPMAFSEDSGMATDVHNIFHDATTGLLGKFRHGHRFAQYDATTGLPEPFEIIVGDHSQAGQNMQRHREDICIEHGDMHLGSAA